MSSEPFLLPAIPIPSFIKLESCNEFFFFFFVGHLTKSCCRITTRFMFHLFTSLYVHPLAAHTESFFSLSTVIGYMVGWVMWNGPHWCNRLNYCMRCLDWIQTRHLTHKLNKKYFTRRKNQCMPFISRLRSYLPYAVFPDEPIYIDTRNLKSNVCVCDHFQSLHLHTELWPAQLFKAKWIQKALSWKCHRL